MKIFAALLIVHSATGFAPAIQGKTSSALFSYLGNINGVPETAPRGGTQVSTPIRDGAPYPKADYTEDLGTNIKREFAEPSGSTKKFWDSPQVTVQGGSLRTWSIANPHLERVQVMLKTEGRPLNANVELWQGPDNTPHRMAIYSEDGSLRPFSAVIETPRGTNAIAVRNTGHIEFPLGANVEDAIGKGAARLGEVAKSLAETAKPKTIQGGAITTFPFAPTVESVQVMLKTDGRPLNARVELMQGPNNNKQVMEIYTEDGMDRPFFVVIETPGTGNVVRIVNTGTVEFPLTARVEPYQISDASSQSGRFAGGADFVLDSQW